MKRILAGIMAVVLLLVIPSQLQAASSIRIYMDGVKLETDQPPTTLQGRTMLPLLVMIMMAAICELRALHRRSASRLPSKRRFVA